MSSGSPQDKDSSKRSEPIPIGGSSPFHHRARSLSLSSSSSGSASSPPELATPSSFTGKPPVNVSPSTSPVLSYFMQSPTSPTQKTPGGSSTFPFRRQFTAAPVFEEDESDEPHPAFHHLRRASTQAAGRFSNPQNGTTHPESSERGTGLLRRLSIGGAAFNKPNIENATARSPTPPSAPPNSAVSPSNSFKAFPGRDVRKPHRSATISTGNKPRRAPSPMSERMLKGHFDGFN